MKQLNKLELAVINKILIGHNKLQEQLHNISVKNREMTGVGFFTTLNISKVPLEETGNFKLNNVYAEIDGLQYGAGFLLYIKDGMLDMLEGYCYEDKWPNDFENFELKIKCNTPILHTTLK
jgi:hypothetical protein